MSYQFTPPKNPQSLVLRFMREKRKLTLLYVGQKVGIKPKTIDHIESDRKLITEEEVLFGIDKLNVPRSSVPAITHVDYSARIQTVHADTNPKYHAVISKFKEKTGCPLVVNTSFNVRGEPIICTPTDAFKCFMGTEMDVLAVGNYVLYKEKQDETLKENYEERYELD